MPEIGKTLETTVKIGGSAAMERFERERMSRRQALRKMGITTTLSALALFSADDLARMAAQALKERAGDNKIANQVADEFINAGVALATPPGGGLPGGCSKNATGATKAACCSAKNVMNWCNGYNNQAQCQQCVSGVYGSGGFCSGLGGNQNGYTNGQKSYASGGCTNPSWGF